MLETNKTTWNIQLHGDFFLPPTLPLKIIQYNTYYIYTNNVTYSAVSLTDDRTNLYDIRLTKDYILYLTGNILLTNHLI